MANFNWKYGILPVAAANAAPITCSAGGNKAQEYLGPIEFTGTAGGGSDSATLTYEWTLIDSEGNDRTYWLTGSNLLSTSFDTVLFPFAGNWTATLVVSSSDPDDTNQSSSATVAIGSGSWLRFNPNYGVEYHYTGSTTNTGPYTTLVWADSGSFTAITCSAGNSDADSESEMSTQWIDTTLPLCGSGSLYPSGTIKSVDVKLFYDTTSTITSSDNFYAGFIIANPNNVTSPANGGNNQPYNNLTWGNGALQFQSIMTWYGGMGESNTQKKAIGSPPGQTAFSWTGGTAANGSNGIWGSFFFDVAQAGKAPKHNSTFNQRLSGNAPAGTEVIQVVSVNDNVKGPTGSIMKLGFMAGRDNAGLTLTASLRVKYYYRINRGSAGGDGVF